MSKPELTKNELPEEEHLVTIDEVLSQHPNTSPVPVLPQLSVALGLLALVFSVTYLGMSGVPDTKIQASNTVRIDTPLPAYTQNAFSKLNAFENVSLLAKSAIVWDVQQQKILFNKNADDIFPLASITKLMTALVAHKLLDPGETIPISLSALKTEGDSGFTDGEAFTMQDLIDLTLIESSNDGAVALGAAAGSAILQSQSAEEVFIHAMNVKAEQLGLVNTTFNNMTGLDLSPEKAGAYGSARDVALLMEHIITVTPDLVAQTTVSETAIHNTDGAYHTVENTNDIVRSIDGLIASKTGYTPLAGGNLVVAYNAGLNRPIIVVVLGSTHEGRFHDTLALIDRTRAFVVDDSN